MPKSNPQLLSIGLLLLVVGLVLGFLFGKNNQNISIPLIQNNQKEDQANAMFQSQSASAQGTITKVDGNNITFMTDDNKTGTFPLAPRFTIYKFAKSAQAKAYSDIKDIELDKKAVIGLQLINNTYQITTITYPFIQPQPSPLPTKKR